MLLVRRAPGCAVWFALAAGGCSVSDKHPDTTDGGPADGDPGGPSGALETRLDAAPDEFSREGQAVFRFSSSDPAAHFECRVDEEAAHPCQSPYERGLSDGPHSFSVRAIDAAGNGDDTPAEKLWTIDTVAPDTQLTEAPQATDNSVMAMFSFSSREVNVSFECSLDGAAFLPCTSGAGFGPVGDGMHEFTVRARDRAGNIDATPETYRWRVDTSTPDTQIVSGPDGAVASTDAEFTFVSPDASGGTFQCSLDNAAFARCTSPVGYPNLREGNHSFRVLVTDAVGNSDPTPATRTWTVDLTAPNTTISDGPAGVMPIASASFAFTSNEADVAFSCSLDGAPFAACASPTNLPGLAQGAHSFAVRATDAAGHTDASPATRNWTVDTVAPDVGFSAGPGEGATSGPRVGIAFSASDGTVMCSLDGAAFAACSSPVATNLSAGAHSFAVRSTDAAGNATTATRNFSVACAAPDAAGAAGLLHLDAAEQALANAADGGASATLGDSVADEPGDPTGLAAARFAGGLAFSAAAGAHVAWPIGLPAMADLTLALWSRPESPAGARDIATSGDGRLALRVTAASPTTVRFSIAVVEGEGGQTRTVSSAAVAARAWHHVVVSLHQPALQLWVDGVRTEVATVALASPVALDALRLGGSGGAAYDGALDEVWLAQTAVATDDAALANYCPL